MLAIMSSLMYRLRCEGQAAAERPVWGVPSTVAFRPDADSLVEEFPSVRTVELADSHGGDQLRVEVSKVHSMSRASLHLDRLPVSDAAAMPKADRAQGFVALDVGLGRARIAFDRDRPELEVHPA